jgi:hypothetical protein
MKICIILFCFVLRLLFIVYSVILHDSLVFCEVLTEFLNNPLLRPASRFMGLNNYLISKYLLKYRLIGC